MVDNHLSTHPIDNIAIPKFDGAEPVHKRLAGASRDAHRAAVKSDEAGLRRAEREIDRIVPALWKK